MLDASNLVRTPISLASRFRDVIESLFSLPSTPRLGVQALLDAYDFSPSTARPANPVTQVRTIEQANYDATVALVRRMIVTQITRLAAAAAAPVTAGKTGYDSYEDAVAVRDAIVERIDALVENTDDNAYGALVQQRADVTAAVPGDDHNVPHLVPHTPPVSEASLALCYRFYGSIALDTDLVTRNRVRHPGFVPGGRALQVLAHA